MSARARRPIDWAEVRRRVAAAASARTMSPERARALMEERARRLALRPDDSGATVGLPQALVFSVNRARYALPAVYVQEVAPLDHVAPLPGASELLLGVTSRRGAILAVFRAGLVLGDERPEALEPRWLVICGERRAEFALPADDVHGLAPLDPRDALAPIGPAEAAGRRHVRGMTREGALLLDGASLLADPRLKVDQTQA